jgi:uncharacterized membrane protein
MATLVAIAYEDESTALEAAKAAERLADDVVLQPDAIAAVVRGEDGTFHVTTNHHAVGAGATWGMFWGVLFGMLFFVPFFGMTIGAGLGALLGKLERSGVETDFQEQARALVKPGTSALFLIVEQDQPDEAVEALSEYGGTVLESSLSKETEEELQDVLHGGSEQQPVEA